MADKREFLVVIDGRESVSPAAGKASDSLGKLGDQAKKTEQDFGGLDRKLRAHADTIGHLRAEIAKTGDTKLFGELGKQEREFSKLVNLRKKFVKEGEDAASGFGAAFIGRVGPLLARLPISGPMGIGLAAAATAAMPAVGAVVAAGLIGGAGIGGVVGGLVVAGKDPKVKAAAAVLGQDINRQLKEAFKPFTPAALNAISILGDEARQAQPDLVRVGDATARLVEPLTRGVARGGRGLLDGLADAAEGAEPVIDALADGIGDLGETAGHLFSRLSDEGPAAAQATRDAFGLLNLTLASTGATIEALTKSYGFLRKAHAFATGDWDTLMQIVTDEARAESDAKKATEDNTAAMQEQASAAYTTAQMVDLLTTALDRQVDEALSAAEAHLRYRESLAQAKETIDGKIGANLKEERALLNLARATNEQTRAMDESDKSAAQVKDQYDEATAAFIQTAIKMGYTEKAARQLAEQLLKIPKRVATDILVNTAPAYAKIREVQKTINNIRGKTVTINVRREYDFAGALDQGAMHGGVRAAGGPVKAGMQYTVGEQGRETFVAPRDGYIINNRDTAMLAAGGAPSASFAAAPMRGGGSWSLSIIPGADRMLRELISKALLFELRTDAGTRQQMKAVLT